MRSGVAVDAGTYVHCFNVKDAYYNDDCGRLFMIDAGHVIYYRLLFC